MSLGEVRQCLYSVGEDEYYDAAEARATERMMATVDVNDGACVRLRARDRARVIACGAVCGLEVRCGCRCVCVVWRLWQRRGQDDAATTYVHLTPPRSHFHPPLAPPDAVKLPCTMCRQTKDIAEFVWLSQCDHRCASRRSCVRLRLRPRAHAGAALSHSPAPPTTKPHTHAHNPCPQVLPRLLGWLHPPGYRRQAHAAARMPTHAWAGVACNSSVRAAAAPA